MDTELCSTDLSIPLSAKNLLQGAAISKSIYILQECQEFALRVALSIPVYSLECQELVLEGCTFYVIYSRECQELALEGCTFHIYLFS